MTGNHAHYRAADASALFVDELASGFAAVTIHLLTEPDTEWSQNYSHSSWPTPWPTLGEEKGYPASTVAPCMPINSCMLLSPRKPGWMAHYALGSYITNVAMF